MQMKKIRIGWWDHPILSTSVKFMIIEQSHRSSSFGKDGTPEFICRSLSYAMASRGAMQVSNDCFFVLGSDRSADQRILETSRSFFNAKVVPIVMEYNVFFNKNVRVSPDPVVNFNGWWREQAEAADRAEKELLAKSYSFPSTGYIFDRMPYISGTTWTNATTAGVL